MGTLGCINDMLQRDKENRELRKLNRDRMKEHHKYLVGKGKNADLSNVSIEKIEEIRKKTIEKEQSDQIYMFRIYIFLTICLLVEGGNLAASKIRNLECPNYEICLIDYGCGKFNRKIHIMEQYP